MEQRDKASRGSQRTLRDSICLVLIIVCALPVSPSAPVAQAFAEVTPPGLVRTLAGIEEYHLENGLRVLLARDPSSPTVTVGVTYLVGSRHEGPGERGMTHMLEHMLIKSTRLFPSLGDTLASRGADYNGSTWFERTEFHETLPAGAENLDFALLVEAERMHNAILREADLEKEMAVITNEFEMDENDPSHVLAHRMLSSAYLWHSYAFPTIGNLNEIRHYSLEDLRRFYAEYYQPDNAVLFIGGRFEADETLELVTRHFASIPRPSRQLRRTRLEEPPQEGVRSVTVHHASQVALASLMYHVPAGSHPDSPAIRLLQAILLDESAGPLYRQLVQSGAATRVRKGDSDALSQADPGVMELTFEVAPDRDASTVLARGAEVVESQSGSTISDDMVALARARLLKQIRQITIDVGRLGVELSEWIALGDWRLFFYHRDRIGQLSAGDVARVAEKYLVETNRTEGLLLPHPAGSRAVVPASPDLDSLLADLPQQAIEPAETEAPLGLEEIKERVIRMTVPPGVELALLPKRTREEMVYAEMRFRYGTEADLTGHSTALRLLPSILMRGTKRLDHAALRSQIDLLQSDIELGGLEGALSVSITTDRQHLIPCLELLAQILTEPAFDPDEFEIVRRDRLGRLRASLSSPVDQTFTALRRSLYPWPETSIHYMPTIEEEIAAVEALSLNTIKRLYRRHLGASHAEVSVVGDFDQGRVLASIGRLFGSWECETRYERISMPHLPIIAGEQGIHIPEQPMAIAALATALELREDDPAYPALKLASHIFVEGDRSRLHDRLREAMALSYHTGGRLSAEVDDRSTYFFAYAFCTPDSAGRALATIRSELDRLVREGITERELEEARSILNQKFEMDLASDAFLSREIVQGLEHDRCFSTYPDLLERMRSMTVTEVGSVLEAALGSAPLASVIAGDLPRRPQ